MRVRLSLRMAEFSSSVDAEQPKPRRWLPVLQIAAWFLQDNYRQPAQETAGLRAAAAAHLDIAVDDVHAMKVLDAACHLQQHLQQQEQTYNTA